MADKPLERMSEELDRQIAEKVMGEARPSVKAKGADIYSPGGGWVWILGVQYWRPLPFSSDLDLAMKAVDKALSHFPSFVAIYSENDGEFWTVMHQGVSAQGSTLPEAICNLLLALVVEEK